MDTRHLDQFSSDQLRRLLDPEADRTSAWSADDAADVWRHQLRSPLPPSWGTAKADSPATTFADALFTPAASLDTLRRVKDYAKTATSAAGVAQPAVTAGATGRRLPRAVVFDEPDLPPDIARLLYYLAIAAASVHHGAAISSLTSGEFEAGVHWCLLRPYVSDAERNLLLAASSDRARGTS
jgi:hypothetical protein